MPQQLTVKVKRFGPDAAKVEQAVRRLTGHAAVRRELAGAEHRVLSARLVEPERKAARPVRPSRVHATIYDYSSHRTLDVHGGLAGSKAPELKTSGWQPHVSRAEYEAAVAVVAGSRELGSAVRKGSLGPYPPMPPVVAVELPDGRQARHVTVGLLPAERGAARHEIVAVDLGRRRLTRFKAGAPPASLARAGVCGVPVDAGQATADQGTPGQAWVTVSQGNTVLWEFLAVRPAASSGAQGSAIELRNVSFKGRSVLYRAHVPILNVRYDGDKCGPYRDWQWQEGMIQAGGADVAPGFRLCPAPAKTILESGTDTGDFLGVGIYVDGLEVVLVSELQAGWYRYVSEWRLHANGQIRPRFGFGATQSSCVCNVHHHHTYWRFDFDVGGTANSVLELEDKPAPGGKKVKTLPFEVKRMRDPARGRRWRVVNAAGQGYTILPGGNDGTAAGDPYAQGDFWALRYRDGEIDDQPSASTEAELDKLVNHESIVNQDVVVWYGAHFTHDVRRQGTHGPDHVVGPTLVSANW